MDNILLLEYNQTCDEGYLNAPSLMVTSKEIYQAMIEKANGDKREVQFALSEEAVKTTTIHDFFFDIRPYPLSLDGYASLKFVCDDIHSDGTICVSERLDHEGRAYDYLVDSNKIAEMPFIENSKFIAKVEEAIEETIGLVS